MTVVLPPPVALYRLQKPTSFNCATLLRLPTCRVSLSVGHTSKQLNLGLSLNCFHHFISPVVTVLLHYIGIIRFDKRANSTARSNTETRHSYYF